MTTDRRARQGARPSIDGPVRPGTPLYRMLEWTAREITRDLSKTKINENRTKPGGGHEPDQPGL